MNYEKLKKDKNNILLGSMGNKKNEYNKYLKNIILDNINKDTFFIEPFTGSAVISYNLYMTNNINCMINDIDHFRIKFYNDCRDINYMNEINNNLLNIKNKDDFNKYVDKKLINKDYNSYIYSKLINSFRYGLYDDKRKIKLLNLHWNKFLNNCIITNNDWRFVMDKYKDVENCMIYLDPPYLNSHNAYYINFDNKYDDKNKKIDNTLIYIDILNYLNISKCKILMSINDNAITRYLYKDYIKNSYNINYNYTHINNENNNDENNKNNDNILIISNFLI